MDNPRRELHAQFGFSPTNFPADLSATTSAAAVDLTSHEGKAVRIRNMDATNQIRIAFGATSALAITAAATGCVIEPSSMEILQPKNNNEFMGYRTVASTATINWQPGY